MTSKSRMRMERAVLPRARYPGDVGAVGALPWTDAFEIAPVPLSMIGAQGALWFGNRAWHRLTGAERLPQRRIGAGWLDAVHRDDRRGALEAFRAAAAERRGIELGLRVEAQDGCRSWWFSGEPYCGPAGEVLVFVGTAHDKTAEREAETRLRELGARLVAAQETERTRIARELHDDLAQRVALLSTAIGAAQSRRPFRATQLRRDLLAARDMLRELADGIYLLSHELHPPKLRLLGLAPTLRSLCQEIAAGCHIPIHFTASVEVTDAADDVSLCVFRVAQQALRNAVTHSAATRVDVELIAGGPQLTLRVSDNGCGFDPASSGAGLGLLTMRERVELVRGSLRIVSAHRRGALIEAIVPFVHRAPFGTSTPLPQA